jgi:hypothetical protein
MRLGGRADLREPFLGKPKRMHWLFGEWGEKNLRDFSRNAGTQPPTVGYPCPGLARNARPLTYPSRSLPERELGLSPPRSHPRFGPSCELIGMPTYESVTQRPVRCAHSNAVRSSRLRCFVLLMCNLKMQNACRTDSPNFPPVLLGETRYVHVRGLGETGALAQKSFLFAALLWCCRSGLN